MDFYESMNLFGCSKLVLNVLRTFSERSRILFFDIRRTFLGFLNVRGTLDSRVQASMAVIRLLNVVVILKFGKKYHNFLVSDIMLVLLVQFLNSISDPSKRRHTQRICMQKVDMSYHS
jgi:hypothetical protein